MNMIIKGVDFYICKVLKVLQINLKDYFLLFFYFLMKFYQDIFFMKCFIYKGILIYCYG